MLVRGNRLSVRGQGSIGSLDGTIYFGGAGGRIYRYPAPSW